MGSTYGSTYGSIPGTRPLVQPDQLGLRRLLDAPLKMPVYDFSCPAGHMMMEAYLPLRDAANPKCEECGMEMERVWGLGSAHRGTQIFPYVTKNLNGKPIEIKSPGHLRELCKIHGKVLRDDVAYINERYEGYDFGHYDPDLKRRVGDGQRYSEGSGRGMRGQWF